MGGGSGGSNNDSTQRTEPWGPTKGYLGALLPDIQEQIVDQPLEFYPGQTYADFAPATQAGLSMTEQRAFEPSVVDQAQGMAADTLAGNYLGENPYFDAMYDRLKRRVGETVGSYAAQAGRGMGSAEGQVVGRNVADAMAPLMFADYGNERSRMLQAAQMAPGLDQAGYIGADRLLGAGEMRQAQVQRGIDEAVRRFDFGQSEPYQRLASGANLIGGIGGMGGTSQQQLQGSGPTPWDMGLRLVGK